MARGPHQKGLKEREIAVTRGVDNLCCTGCRRLLASSAHPSNEEPISTYIVCPQNDMKAPCFLRWLELCVFSQFRQATTMAQLSDNVYRKTATPGHVHATSDNEGDV